MLTDFKTFKRLNEVYQEAGNSTFSQDSAVYDLNKLFVLTDAYPVSQIAVAELAWILHEGAPDPVRVNKADYTVPVLVTMWQGHAVVVDGLHRVAKAFRDGIVRIPCKMVPTSVLGQCLMPDNGTAAYVSPQEDTHVSTDGMEVVTSLPTAVEWPGTVAQLEGYEHVIVTLAEDADADSAARELSARGMLNAKAAYMAGASVSGDIPSGSISLFTLPGAVTWPENAIQL